MSDGTPAPLPWANCRNCKAPIARTDSWFDVNGTRPWCTACVTLRREGRA